LVCLQITSQAYGDAAAILFAERDFAEGTLARPSHVRPGKLFTAHVSLFHHAVARIGETKLAEVRQAVIALIQHGRFKQPTV
jgi:mRNA interferase MazF